LLSRPRARKRVRRKHSRRRSYSQHHGKAWVRHRFAALAKKYHGRIPKGTRLK